VILLVKIENDFGDVLTGKCSNAIYQKHYGRQIRRKGYKETKEPSPQQIKQRNKFKDAIAWVKTLTSEQRIGLKNYYETSKLGYQKNMPVNWYNFAKYCYIKNPIFQILDDVNNSYNLIHPSILRVVEKSLDESIIYIIDNLTVLENGVLCDNFHRTPEILTAYIELTLITGQIYTYYIEPVKTTTLFFDASFFDYHYFE